MIWSNYRQHDQFNWSVIQRNGQNCQSQKNYWKVVEKKLQPHLSLGRRKRQQGGVACQGVHCLSLLLTLYSTWSPYQTFLLGRAEDKTDKNAEFEIVGIVEIEVIWFPQAHGMEQLVPCISWETELVPAANLLSAISTCWGLSKCHCAVTANVLLY